MSLVFANRSLEAIRIKQSERGPRANLRCTESRKRTIWRSIGEKRPTASLHRTDEYSGGSLCPQEVPIWRGKLAFFTKEIA